MPLFGLSILQSRGDTHPPCGALVTTSITCTVETRVEFEGSVENSSTQPYFDI